MKNLLRIHNWIDCLTEEIKKTVVSCMHKKRLESGEIVFSAGDKADALYRVQQGELESSTLSGAGKEFILNINYPGDCFGETSLVNGYPRFFTVTARHCSLVSVLPAGEFERLRREHPNINHALLRTQSTRLQIMATRAGSYALKSLRQIMLERLIFLSESCRTQESGAALIQLGLSQKEYGKLFGASRQSVNKELNLLQQQNLIKIQKNGIFIYNVEELSNVALKNS